VSLPVGSVIRESGRRGGTMNDGAGDERAPPMALHDGERRGLGPKRIAEGAAMPWVRGIAAALTEDGGFGDGPLEEGWRWQWRWPARRTDHVLLRGFFFFLTLVDETDDCLGAAGRQKGGRR
jgi:hypothetical protein